MGLGLGALWVCREGVGRSAEGVVHPAGGEVGGLKIGWGKIRSWYGDRKNTALEQAAVLPRAVLQTCANVHWIKLTHFHLSQFTY